MKITDKERREAQSSQNKTLFKAQQPPENKIHKSNRINKISFFHVMCGLGRTFKVAYLVKSVTIAAQSAPAKEKQQNLQQRRISSSLSHTHTHTHTTPVSAYYNKRGPFFAFFIMCTHLLKLISEYLA